MAADYKDGTSTIQMVRVAGNCAAGLLYLRLEALRVIRRHQGKGVFVTAPKTLDAGAVGSGPATKTPVSTQ
ncbi:hypothetical protein ABT346_16445 [Micromonospora peucetia]|uniref:hypothetical protein n=1 Tax=Micromonospora peucetia TaxID=47871 RepID=UPI003318A04E